MRVFSLIFVLAVSPVMTGCGPVAAIGAVGTTVTNAAYNEDARRNQSGYISPQQRSDEVADANLYLGIEYMQQGNYEKALDKLNRANSARSNHATTNAALGLLYQQMGDAGVAETYFKRALKIDPSDPSTLNNYGLFLCQNQRFVEAEDSFLKAAGNPLYSNPEIAYTNAGTCARSNNETEKAETYFMEALKKNPQVAQALIQLAEITYDRYDLETARTYLQRYLELARHTSKSLWLGIRIEQGLGDKDAVSSYALLLRNNFPGTEEYGLLSESRIK